MVLSLLAIFCNVFDDTQSLVEGMDVGGRCNCTQVRPKYTFGNVNSVISLGVEMGAAPGSEKVVWFLASSIGVVLLCTGYEQTDRICSAVGFGIKLFKSVTVLKRLLPNWRRRRGRVEAENRPWMQPSQANGGAPTESGNGEQNESGGPAYILNLDHSPTGQTGMNGLASRRSAATRSPPK